MNGALNVLLERCTYARPALSALLERMSPFLGIARNLRGKRVLLKPNLISAHGPVLACTFQPLPVSTRCTEENDPCLTPVSMVK